MTLGDPMDYSPPGSSVQRLLQARILERVPARIASPKLIPLWNMLRARSPRRGHLRVRPWDPLHEWGGHSRARRGRQQGALGWVCSAEDH